jgi:hypothetical protein
MNTVKNTITRKVTNALVLASLLVGSMGIVATPQYNVSAKSCGVGYVKKDGKCVPIEITQNEKLSRTAHCLTNHGESIKSFQSCMRTHNGNKQVR